MEIDIKKQEMINPSLNDLERQLKTERTRLMETYGTEEERHEIISRIRMLRSSIDMLKGYMEHFRTPETA